VPDSSCGSLGERPPAGWSFNIDGVLTEWDWAVAPDPYAMGSTRQIRRARARQSYAPAWAFSVTTGTQLRLESGLEHDLVRELDRQPQVRWLVSQPACLEWPRSPSRRATKHTPDLLSLDADGAVTVWDVRPREKQDEEFVLVSELTRAACADVGWRYEVFSEIPPVRRSNLLWLSGFRRPMPWHASSLAVIRDSLSGEGTLADVQHLDDGAGHILSAMWHGIWSGLLDCDLDEPFTGTTRLTVSGEL